MLEFFLTELRSKSAPFVAKYYSSVDRYSSLSVCLLFCVLRNTQEYLTSAASVISDRTYRSVDTLIGHSG